VDLDGFGACEGTLTCSTCHLIFTKPDYEKLPDKPTDEELDMLDLAYDLSDTSRLGCQIILSKELDGLEVKVPATVNDARSWQRTLPLILNSYTLLAVTRSQVGLILSSNAVEKIFGGEGGCSMFVIAIFDLTCYEY